MRQLRYMVCACLLMSACGYNNLATRYVSQTDDEQAKAHLENGEYAAAITLLESLIAEEPTEYRRYALIAAAYAQRAGLDIFNVAKAKISGGDSVFAQIGVFLPAKPTTANITDMQTALARLKAIPAALRTFSAVEPYSASAAFQLTLYQAAYAAMYLNQFVVLDPLSGQYDQDELAKMSDADVEAILAALADAAASGEGVTAAMGEAINQTIDSIEAMSGSSKREQLINYLNQSETSD